MTEAENKRREFTIRWLHGVIQDAREKGLDDLANDIIGICIKNGFPVPASESNSRS